MVHLGHIITLISVSKKRPRHLLEARVLPTALEVPERQNPQRTKTTPFKSIAEAPVVRAGFKVKGCGLWQIRGFLTA